MSSWSWSSQPSFAVAPRSSSFPKAQGDSQKRAAEAKTGTTMEMTTEMNAVESKTSNGVGTKVDEIDSGKVTGWHQGVQQRQHQYKLQPHVATDDVHELTALGR